MPDRIPARGQHVVRARPARRPARHETLTLKPGETKVFNTDWKYEKRRNDGSQLLRQPPSHHA
jgi:hypothetical protein